MNCQFCGGLVLNGECEVCDEEFIEYVKPSDPKSINATQKPQLQLIPPSFNAELAKALELGASRYGAWNWRESNIELMTYLGAMRRHIDRIIDGEMIDPESGAHHCGHIAASCAIIIDAQKNGTMINNAPKHKA